MKKNSLRRNLIAAYKQGYRDGRQDGLERASIEAKAVRLARVKKKRPAKV